MKRLLLLILTFITTTPCMANVTQAPPNFKHKGIKAVFVDFKKANYDIKLSNFSFRSRAKSTIQFYMPESGYPIFDSVNKPLSVTIDGIRVPHLYIKSPEDATKFRIVKKVLPKGLHTMVIQTKMKNGVFGSLLGVSAGFFIRDLKDRRFLEKYLPSSFEYDQYKMIFNVKVKSSFYSHHIFANGKVTKHRKNSFTVEFPDYYTCSSLFFHLSPVHKYSVLKFTYPSLDGRKIPITIYSINMLKNYRYKKKTIEVLRELENDYGPFPHPELIVYGTLLPGGMEYSGAIETSYASIGHELQHQYFAKGVLPANGNSGWIDEGIASWRDNGHQIHKKPNFSEANLGNNSLYTRHTHKKSYILGRSFIAYLDYKLKDNGMSGMKEFLRFYSQKRMYTTITNLNFMQDLQEFSGMDFNADFKKYIFGNKNKQNPQTIRKCKHHPQVSENDLNSII